MRNRVQIEPSPRTLETITEAFVNAIASLSPDHADFAAQVTAHIVSGLKARRVEQNVDDILASAVSSLASRG